MIDHIQSLQFAISDLPDDLFDVYQVVGEEAISRLFRFEIDLVSNDPQVALSAMTNKEAVLKIERFDTVRTFHGIVTEAVQTGATPNARYLYKVTLAPRLHRLTMSRQNQIHGTAEPASVIEIIEAELTAARLKGPPAAAASGRLGTQDYEFHVTQKYPVRDYVVQYDETDFDFVARLAERNGIFYFFRHTEGRDVVVFGDARTAFLHADVGTALPYRPDSGLTDPGEASISAITCTVRSLPEKIYLRDFNYRLPHLSLLVEAVVDPDGHGSVVEHGGNFRTPEEGQRLARIRAEELRCRQTQFFGTSDCIQFAAGHVFRLVEHFRNDFNQDHLVVAVRHEATQALPGIDGLGGPPRTTGYRNTFESIPGSLEFRPERLTRKPVMAGLGNAVVDAEGSGKRADIDEHGRYKIKQYFDLRDEGDGKASRFVRKAESYGGSQYGMHFPLLKGAEVIVAHVNGDPDRPVIMGAVPNPQQESMVTASNHTMNRIRTPTGVAIEIDDGQSVGDESEGGALRPGEHVARILVPSTNENQNQQSYFRLGTVSEGEDSPSIHDSFKKNVWKEYLHHDPAELGKSGYLLYTKGDSTTVVEGSQYAQISGSEKRVVEQGAYVYIGDREEKLVIGDAPIDISNLLKNPLLDKLPLKTPVFTLPVDPWQLMAYQATFADPLVMIPTTVTLGVGSSIGLNLGNATSFTIGMSQDYALGASTSIAIGWHSSYDLSLAQSLSLSGTLSTSIGLEAALKASLSYGFTAGVSLDYTMGPSYELQTESWEQRVQPLASPLTIALGVFNGLVMATQSLLALAAMAFATGYAGASVGYAVAANATANSGKPMDLSKNPLNAAGVVALGGTTAVNCLLMMLQMMATAVGVTYQFTLNRAFQDGPPDSAEDSADKAMDTAEDAEAAGSSGGSGGSSTVVEIVKWLAKTAAEEAVKMVNPGITMNANPLKGIVLGYDGFNYIKITPLGIEIFATQVSIVTPVLQSFGTRKHAGLDGVWGASNVFGPASATTLTTARVDAFTGNFTVLQAPDKALPPTPPVPPIPDLPPIPPPPRRPPGV